MWLPMQKENYITAYLTHVYPLLCSIFSQRDLGQDNDGIHLSRPLLHPSRDLDQMPKEHDRRIQVAALHARYDKVKLSKVLAW